MLSSCCETPLPVIDNEMSVGLRRKHIPRSETTPTRRARPHLRARALPSRARNLLGAARRPPRGTKNSESSDTMRQAPPPPQAPPPLSSPQASAAQSREEAAWRRAPIPARKPQSVAEVAQLQVTQQRRREVLPCGCRIATDARSATPARDAGDIGPVAQRCAMLSSYRRYL